MLHTHSAFQSLRVSLRLSCSLQEGIALLAGAFPGPAAAFAQLPLCRAASNGAASSRSRSRKAPAHVKGYDRLFQHWAQLSATPSKHSKKASIFKSAAKASTHQQQTHSRKRRKADSSSWSRWYGWQDAEMAEAAAAARLHPDELHNLVFGRSNSSSSKASKGTSKRQHRKQARRLAKLLKRQAAASGAAHAEHAYGYAWAAADDDSGPWYVSDSSDSDDYDDYDYTMATPGQQWQWQRRWQQQQQQQQEPPDWQWWTEEQERQWFQQAWQQEQAWSRDGGGQGGSQRQQQQQQSNWNSSSNSHSYRPWWERFEQQQQQQQRQQQQQSHSHHNHQQQWGPWSYGGTSSSSSSSSHSSSQGPHAGSNAGSHWHQAHPHHPPSIAQHLTVLGLPPNTHLHTQQLKVAFHRAAMQWHPDKHVDATAKAAAEAKFKQVKAAYELLVQHVAS